MTFIEIDLNGLPTQRRTRYAAAQPARSDESSNRRQNEELNIFGFQNAKFKLAEVAT